MIKCLSQLQQFYGHTHTKCYFFAFFPSHWKLCSTPSVPQQQLFFSPSLFVSQLTYWGLPVGLQVNGMHTKSLLGGKRQLQRTRKKKQGVETNRFLLKFTLDKFNVLTCLLPPSLVLHMQLLRDRRERKIDASSFLRGDIICFYIILASLLYKMIKWQ